MTTESLSRRRQTGPSDRQSTLAHSEAQHPPAHPGPPAHPPNHPSNWKTRHHGTKHLTVCLSFSLSSSGTEKSHRRKTVCDGELLPPGVHKGKTLIQRSKEIHYFRNNNVTNYEENGRRMHSQDTWVQQETQKAHIVFPECEGFNCHQRMVNDCLKPNINFLQ